jgi:hypothetical protein
MWEIVAIVEGEQASLAQTHADATASYTMQAEA